MAWGQVEPNAESWPPLVTYAVRRCGCTFFPTFLLASVAVDLHWTAKITVLEQIFFIDTIPYPIYT